MLTIFSKQPKLPAEPFKGVIIDPRGQRCLVVEIIDGQNAGEKQISITIPNTIGTGRTHTPYSESAVLILHWTIEPKAENQNKTYQELITQLAICFKSDAKALRGNRHIWQKKCHTLEPEKRDQFFTVLDKLSTQAKVETVLHDGLAHQRSVDDIRRLQQPQNPLDVQDSLTGLYKHTKLLSRECEILLKKTFDRPVVISISIEGLVIGTKSFGEHTTNTYLQEVGDTLKKFFGEQWTFRVAEDKFVVIGDGNNPEQLLHAIKIFQKIMDRRYRLLAIPENASRSEAHSEYGLDIALDNILNRFQLSDEFLACEQDVLMAFNDPIQKNRKAALEAIFSKRGHIESVVFLPLMQALQKFLDRGAPADLKSSVIQDVFEQLREVAEHQMKSKELTYDPLQICIAPVEISGDATDSHIIQINRPNLILALITGSKIIHSLKQGGSTEPIEIRSLAKELQNEKAGIDHSTWQLLRSLEAIECTLFIDGRNRKSPDRYSPIESALTNMLANSEAMKDVTLHGHVLQYDVIAEYPLGRVLETDTKHELFAIQIDKHTFDADRERANELFVSMVHAVKLTFGDRTIVIKDKGGKLTCLCHTSVRDPIVGIEQLASSLEMKAYLKNIGGRGIWRFIKQEALREQVQIEAESLDQNDRHLTVRYGFVDAHPEMPIHVLLSSFHDCLEQVPSELYRESEPSLAAVG